MSIYYICPAKLRRIKTIPYMIRATKKTIWMSALFLLSIFGLNRSSAAVYVVTNPVDGNLPFGLPGSLREAINLANVFTIGLDTIDVSGLANIEQVSEFPFIASDMLIRGPVNGLTIINGNFASSVLTIANTGSGNPNVELRNIAIRNGFGDGGGLNIQTANVIIRNCSVNNNFGSQSIGGGIRINNADVQILNSNIRNNINFGGIGGGIATSGIVNVSIVNSTILGNRASVGAGIDVINPANITITNSTIVDNISSGNGGGIYINAGFINLNNSIVFLNDAQSVADTGNDIAVNQDSTDNRVNSTFGHNIIGDLTGFTFNTGANTTGNIINPAANEVFNLPLAISDNGGPTLTLPLNACSRAIDAGNNAVNLPTDQRGFARVNTIDIGSFEYNSLIVQNGTSCGPNSVQLSVSGGTSGPNGFNWFDAETGGNLLLSNSAIFNTPVLTQTTTFYVSEATISCPNPRRFPVTATIFPIPPTPTITFSGVSTTICDNATITLTANVSQPGLSFLWNPGGATTQEITVNNQASYTVTVISSNNCTAVSEPLQINVVPPPPTPTIFTSSGGNEACQGEEVTLISSSPINNVWSTGATSQQITVDQPGTYSVTVSSAPNCTSSSSFIFSNFPTPPTPVVTLTGTTPFCFGNGNSVTLESDIANGIVWSNGETTQQVIIDTTGIYTVTFTDANGCSATSLPVNILSNIAVVPTITALGDTTFCDGNSVELVSSPAVSYNWSVGGNTNSVIVSSTQNVTVTTIDNNGCEATSAPKIITVNQNIIPVVSPSGQITICQGETVTLTSDALNGNLWSNGETTQSIIVGTPGIYTVEVVGCSLPSVPVEIIVNEVPPIPLVSANGPLEFCEGGTVTLTATVGSGNILWNDNVTSSNQLTVTSSGTYFITESNALNCSSQSLPVVVTVFPNPISPVITANGATEFCIGQSVLLNSDIPSGVNWSTNVFATGINVTESGNYFATITDNNNCTAQSNVISVVVNEPIQPTINADGPLTFCDGQSVNLTAEPAAVNYVWSNVNTNTQSINVNQTTNNITVTTTDANGCSATSFPVNVIANPNAVPSITPSGNISFCDGDFIVLTSSSPTGNLWSTGETSQSITVSSTINNITVSVDGCSLPSEPVSVTVNSNPAIPVITSPTNFVNCSNQTVELSSSAAAAYFWSGNLGISQTVQASQPGNYTVTVFDANGCSATSTPVTVSFTTIPASPVITSSNGTNTFCSGSSVILSSSYNTNNLWSTGETSQEIIVNQPGIYSVSHTDANGCTSNLASISIIEIPAVVPQILSSGPLTFCEGGSVLLTSSISAGNIWSTGETTQSILVNQTTLNITVQNNVCNITSLPLDVIVNPIPNAPVVTPQGPVQICSGNTVTLISSESNGNLWNTLETGNQINVTQTGNYFTTVTNAEGCSASSNVVSVEVTNLPFVNLGGDRTECTPVVLNAGNAGSTYLWSTGETTQTITVNSTTQNISVLVTNVCGSFLSDPIDVTITPQPVVNLGGPFVTCNTSVTLDAGNPGSSYLWTVGGQTTQTITVNESGVYSVVVTTLQGCIATGSAEVIINTTPPAITLNDAATCGTPVTLNAFSPGATYLWSTGATTPSETFTQSNPAVFVSVTNSCGTTLSNTVSINIIPALVVNLGNDIAQCGGEVQLNAGITNANYQWSGPSGIINQNTQIIAVSQSGNYTVVVTDLNGCTGTDQVFVNLDNTLPSVNLGNNITQCGGEVVLNAQNQGSVYLWSTGETTQTISISQTNPAVFVSVTNGCGTTISNTISVQINPTPVVNLGNDISQCGGSVQIASNILNAANYVWTGPNGLIPQTTPTITVSQTGLYTVTLTDANGCSGSDNVFVNLDGAVPVVNLGNDLTQCGGTVTLNAGNPGSSYLWSTGETTQTIDVSETGSYFVSVTNSCGTTLSESVDITINPIPVLSIQTPEPVCNSTVSLNAGNPGSTYLWTPGGLTDQILVATVSGAYTVTVTNALGCSASQTINVIIDTNLPIVNLGNDISQCGGQVTLDAQNPGANYLWSPFGQTTQTIQAFTTGNYSVVVSNACGQSTDQVLVSIGEEPEIDLDTEIEACLVAILTVGPQPPGTTYNWNNGQGSLPFFTALTSGQYSVTVTNAEGCSQTASTNVNISNQTPTVNLGDDGINCGEICLDASNTGSSFLWTPGGETSQVLCINTTGTYGVTVTNGCGVASDQIALQILTNLTVDLGNDISICNPQQPVVLNSGVTGAGVTYEWSNQSGVIAGETGATLTVTASGVYSVLVTNADGCTGTDAVTVDISTGLPIVNIENNIESCGPVTLDAGNPGASYLWSTGATTQTISVTQSTVQPITVTVTNACGNITSDPINVTILPNLTVDLGNDISICNPQQPVVLNSGVTGAGVTYEWSNQSGVIAGETGATLTVTASGVYSVLVTNADGCTGTDAVTVNISTGLPVVNIENNIESCGPITLDAGNPGASYLWSTGATTQTISVTQSTVQPITVTVTNACGNITSDPINVTILPNLIVDLGNDISICNPQQPVVLNSGVTGAGVTYEWSNQSGVIAGETGATLTVTASGVYSVLVTNADGCTGTDAVTVDISTGLPVVSLPDNLSDCGEVTLDAQNPGASYLWSSGETTQTIVVNQLTPQPISVIVTNACGSATSNSVSVTFLPNLNIDLGVPNTICLGGGSVTLDAGTQISGSTFVWSNQNGVIAGETQQTLIVNSPGTYSVLVSSPNGCTGTDNVIISGEGNAPVVNLGGPISVCFGPVQLDAGNPGSSYVWDVPGNPTSQTVLVNQSGTYTVTVTNSCGSSTGSVVVNITSGNPATITSSGPTTICQGNTVTLTATQGASYLWTPGGETTQSITVSSTGVYACNVTFADGCVSTTPLTQVNVTPLPPTPSITITGNLTFCQGGNVRLRSSNLFNNVWSNGATTQEIIVFNSGTYTVSTVVNGCSSTSQPVNVTVNFPPNAVVTTLGNTTLCEGDSVQLRVTSGDDPNNTFTYQWFFFNNQGQNIPVGTGQTIYTSTAGNYVATVTDNNGCSTTTFPETNIVVRDSATTPIITIDGNLSNCGGGVVTLTSSVSQNIIWSTGETIPTISITASGTYTVTAVNGFCTKTSKPVIIDVNPSPPIELTLIPKVYTPGNHNVSANGASDGEISYNVQGGREPFTVQWLDSANNPISSNQTIVGLKAGWYKLLITDANGCTARDSVKLTEPLPFQLPEGFSPNGDGKNDKFVVGSIELYPVNTFVVYNRWGNIVYNKDNYQNEWDGNSNNGQELPVGTYFITLEIPGREMIKGFVELRR